jgi:stage III sporulation protein AH
MFVLKRNQIIITALVIMIAVAGYLNYLDTRVVNSPGIPLTDQGEIAALVPDLSFINEYAFQETGNAWTVDDNPAIAVSGAFGDLDFSELVMNIPETDYTEAGEAVFVNTSRDSSYFVQAKLNREQSRATEKEILTDLINNANVEAAHKAKAADSMLEIQKRIERESAAEAMIESKGFSEVYVRIDDNSVDVVVNKEALTDAEIAQIEDIIKRKTGMSENQIHISPIRR